MKTPALDLWRDEIRHGLRRADTLDVLWRAACLEAAAREFADIPSLAEAYLADARQLVISAARSQQRTGTR